MMQTVRSGSWMYDGTTKMPVRIVALPYDHWYELAKADDQLEPGEEPTPLGPDGVLYYASFTSVDSSGFSSIEAAQAAAEARLGSPIQWDANVS